eukprot:CAMPEP_0174917094 /NCGR_PEP_ID=MMETSP1355-20121228/2261_1 /TAXON_ID=464990 /ORGANISM="Hemiselmis tepida, Strain CCMP443" /LENGTH=288 /DNA_ID=CAMNT_0016162159 /DNA_START=89 /DNA_END=956 /DNA_ORIENTATION=-
MSVHAVFVPSGQYGGVSQAGDLVDGLSFPPFSDPLFADAQTLSAHCHFVPDKAVDHHPIPSLPLSPGLNSWENAGPQECDEEQLCGPLEVPPWHREVDAAVAWLASFLPQHSAFFESELRVRIGERCAQSWHPEAPQRGSGYRSIMLPREGRKDPLVLQAAQLARVSELALRDLPSCVLWVDPGRVASRLDSYNQYEASAVVFLAATEADGPLEAAAAWVRGVGGRPEEGGLLAVPRRVPPGRDCPRCGCWSGLHACATDSLMGPGALRNWGGRFRAGARLPWLGLGE